MPSPISPTDTFSKFLAFFGLFLYASGLIDVWRGIEPLQNDVLIKETDTNIERAWQKIERIDKKRLNALAEELEHAKEKGDFKGKEIVAILDKIKRESYEMARKNAKLRGDHHFECGDPGAMNGPNFILNRLEKGLANSREALEVAWRINTGIIILGILMSAVGISSWYRRIRNIRGEEFAKEVKDRKAADF